MSLLRGYARKLGVMEYLGTWDASTNTPQLTSSVGQRGGYYVVSVAGTTNLNGVNDWALKDWVIFNGTAWEKIDNSELVTSVAGRTGEIVLTSNDITDFDESALNAAEVVFAVQKEPTGFPNQTDSVLSFNESTRTLSIGPTNTSFDVWHQGVKSTISTTLTKQIPNVSGSYFFYITAAGVLDYSTTFNIAILTQYAYTAYVYWNAADGKATSFGEERHGLSMDGATHGYLHTTRGTQLSSGAAIEYNDAGDGSNNSHAQINLSDMQIRDEDILAPISNSANPTNRWEQKLSPIAYLPIYYRNNSAFWSKNTGTEYPLMQGTNRAKYNKFASGTWTLEEASANNKFLVSYVFATTNIAEPVIVLLGQDEYLDLNDALARAAWSKVNFGDLPAQEMKLLYILIYETSALFSNTPKAAIRAVRDLRYGGDREVNAISSVTDHGNLSGLGDDDHQQYLLINGTRAMSDDLNMNSNQIKNVAEPTLNQDAATKNYVDSGISTETSLRLSADSSLTTRLSTEESTRTAADASLTTRLSTEESTRLSADSSLTTRLSTEESTRLSADSSLTTRVSTEESARTAEDLTFLKLDGSRLMTGSLNMNANSISNVNNLTATGLTTLSNAAITKNSINYGIQIPTSTTVSTNGTLTLTATSNSLQFLTGTATGFSVVLPSSLTVAQGQYFEIYNTSTSSVIIKKASGATLTSLNANSVIKITAQTTAAIDGDWLTWSLEVQVASGITNYTLASTTAFATASATDVQITSFVLTPMAGTYAIWYNASNQSTNNNALNYISLYKDTVQITGTERVTQSVASNFVFQMSTQGTTTFNGAEQLRVYARVSAGTFTVNARSLIMIRLGG